MMNNSYTKCMTSTSVVFVKTIVCGYHVQSGSLVAAWFVKESLSNMKQILLIARQHNTVCPLAGSDGEIHVRNSCNGVVRVGSNKPPDSAW